MNARHQALRSAILGYGEKAQAEMTLKRIVPSDVFAFVRDEPNAFLFGLIADQSVRAEIAWSLPFRLKERLGHLEIPKIARMKPGELGAVLATKPALHRYPNTMARNLVSAAQSLLDKYRGRACEIWAPPAKALQIVERLKELKGIGHKKASLGLILLIRNFGLRVADTSAIDIANDLHIRRVFLRTGLAATDSAAAILEAARQLHPEYPGLLTTPVWVAGRTWCKVSGPDCPNCVLTKHCLKLVHLGK